MQQLAPCGLRSFSRRPCGTLGVPLNTLAHSLAGREPSGAMITIRMQMGQYQQSCLPHEDLYFMRLSLSDSGLTFCATSWHPGLLQHSACQQTDHAHR